MRKLSAPVRFLQKLHVYVFFIFLRSPQYGVFTQVAFDTAKRRREQFISIFRTSRESQKHMKIKKQLKGFCLLRNVAKILAISCTARIDPRCQTGYFEAYFVGFVVIALVFLIFLSAPVRLLLQRIF